jgi:hypothetical protein
VELGSGKQLRPKVVAEIEGHRRPRRRARGRDRRPHRELWVALVVGTGGEKKLCSVARGGKLPNDGVGAPFSTRRRRGRRGGLGGVNSVGGVVGALLDYGFFALGP